MNMKSNVTFILAMAASIINGIAVSGPISGTHPLQTDRFSFSLGGHYSDLSGELSLAPPRLDQDIEVDIQDDLGVDDSELLSVFGFTWRYSNTSRIQAEYFNLSQNNKNTLGKSIEWGDLDFDVGAEVKGSLDMDVLRAFWGYSFIKDDKKEFGAGVGLHYLDLDMSLKGEATINGSPTLNVARGIDDWVILPNIGGYGNYAISPKWLVMGRLDWLYVDIGDYAGGLWNMEVGIQYQAFEHAGIGLGYRYVAFDVEAEKDDGDWSINLAYSGPLLLFTANF